MPYASQSDLIALWGTKEVTVCSDWDNAGTLNATNVTNALSSASGVMDRYIAVRYAVPLATPVPDDLVRVCCDIAMYMLCPYASLITEQKKERHENAMKFLRDLSSGKATLGVAQNIETPAVAADITVTPYVTALSGDAMKRIL